MFGADIFNDPTRVVEAMIDTMRSAINNPVKLSAIEAVMERRKAYLMWYGFTTKDELERNPAAMVRMNQAEDSFYGAVIEDRYDEYLDMEVYTHTGMSWEAFISQPKVEIERMLTGLQRFHKRNSTGQGNQLKQLNALLKTLKKTGE